MEERRIVTEVIYDNFGVSHTIEYHEGDLAERKEKIAELRN